MPMGLTTAPPTFQRWMEMRLQGFDDFVLIYLDDVLIYSRTMEEHLAHLEEVFQRFKDKGVRVKLSKCTFCA